METLVYLTTAESGTSIALVWNSKKLLGNAYILKALTSTSDVVNFACQKIGKLNNLVRVEGKKVPLITSYNYLFHIFLAEEIKR